MGFHENQIAIAKKYAVSKIKVCGGNSSSSCVWSLFVTSYDSLKNSDSVSADPSVLSGFWSPVQL